TSANQSHPHSSPKRLFRTGSFPQPPLAANAPLSRKEEDKPPPDSQQMVGPQTRQHGREECANRSLDNLGSEGSKGTAAPLAQSGRHDGFDQEERRAIRQGMVKRNESRSLPNPPCFAEEVAVSGLV